MKRLNRGFTGIFLLLVSCAYVPDKSAFNYCNEVYVVANQAIQIFDGSKSGEVTPSRTVSDTVTATEAYGIAVDSMNNEMYLTDTTSNLVRVFSRSAATGAQTPLRKITGVSGARGIAVDPINNEIFVTSTTSNAVYVYERTADGAAIPKRTITGTGSTLRQPYAIDIDLVHGEIFVGCWQDDSIEVYSRKASGSPTPTRKIVGPNTNLLNLRQIVYDSHSDEIIVAAETPTIAFFARTADGNVVPQRQIMGASTLLSWPTGIALDFNNDKLFVIDDGVVLVFNRHDEGNAEPDFDFTHSSFSSANQVAAAMCKE